MSALAFLDGELRRLEESGALRVEVQAPLGLAVCSNDYIGLSGEPWGPGAPGGATRGGAGASRLVFGTAPEHSSLEQALAAWLGHEGSLLFSSGYAANLGLLSALGDATDVHLFSDELNHASIIDGCRLGRASVSAYPHLDVDALDQALSQSAGHRVVVTESYFSMDGTSPDLARLAELCARRGAALVVDEAHALGVFGPEGRGLAAAAGVRPDVVVGTFGKAFGLQGAFVAGSRTTRAWLWNRARSFIFSTAPSPALSLETQKRLERIRGAESERTRLRELCCRFEERLEEFHVKLDPRRHGPIFPIVLGSAERALLTSADLGRSGFVCPAIRPPTVPAGASRIRITLNASLSNEDVDRLARAVRESCFT